MAYRFDQKTKLLSFGEYPIITLKDARQRGEIENMGSTSANWANLMALARKREKEAIAKTQFATLSKREAVRRVILIFHGKYFMARFFEAGSRKRQEDGPSDYGSLR